MYKDIKEGDEVTDLRQKGMPIIKPSDKVYKVAKVKGEYPSREFVLESSEGEIRMVFESIGDTFVPCTPNTSSVDHPPHYTQEGTIECIDYIESFLSEEEFIGYLRGNIAKYLHRLRWKGKFKEDLGKAEWYIKKLKEFTKDKEL